MIRYITAINYRSVLAIIEEQNYIEYTLSPEILNLAKHIINTKVVLGFEIIGNGQHIIIMYRFMTSPFANETPITVFSNDNIRRNELKSILEELTLETL